MKSRLLKLSELLNQTLRNDFVKRILFTIIAIVFVVVTARALRNGGSGLLGLQWSYPVSELSTGLTFIVYHSTDITIPVSNWNVLAQMPGVSTNIVVSIVPGAHYFVVTSSNFWGESDFSNVALVPVTPKQITNTAVKRLD